MKKLNLTYIKSFVTKFAKDTGANVTLDELFSKGFQPILQYPHGNDYIHPSLKWQKGRLF